MTIQRMPGSAITPGTITITQLESNVATVVSTGGGPKITNIQVTDNAYTVLDDTAVDITGGYITITGTGFVTGCSVIVGQLAAASVTFISSTEVRAQLSAQSAGTYIVYLVNPDGGVGIRVNGVTHSASPAWQTASSLGEQYDGVAISLSLVATDATSYTLTSGSLPPGLSLNSNTGVISGTVSGVANDTLYTFTVRATDAQLQDSPRTFTVTITVSDPYFKLTTLLLSGSAVSANTVVRDSSTNNFNLTVAGDARASNFTPYGTGWSTYFSSTSGITVSALTPIGSGDLTIETFVYMTTLSGDQHMIQQGTSTTNVLLSWDSTTQKLRFLLRNDSGSNNFDIYSPSAPVLNQWFHFAGTVQGTTGRMWINGNVVTTGTVSGTRSGSQTFVYMGDNGSGGSRPLTGYLSNTRIVVGTAVYTANFSPTTTNLSSVSGTSLLTNQSNRFINLVGNVAATISQGIPRITSFNPFNITNTGVNGSMYFDGTTDSVRLPSNAISALPGDFTLEFWIYLISTAGNPVIYLVNATAALIIYVVSSKVVVRSYGTADLLTSVDNIQINTWTHVAVARSGSALSLWLNGSRASGGTITYSTAFPQGEIRIATNESDAQSTNGYIADLRLIKGTAQYNPSNTTITVPTSPLTAVANTQLLTLQYDQPHNNHTFLDSSSNQFLIIRSGNATQGTFSPFSPTGWSAYFDGTGDVLTIPDSAISQLGSSDFTVECWINTSKTTGGSILTKGVDENVTWGNFFFSLTSSGYLFFEIDPTPSTSADRFSLTDTVAINNGQWHHVAVTRSGNDWKLFRNGTIAASGTSSASFPDDTYAWVVGGSRVSGSTTATWVGYISNLRLIKGSAVYTTAFTPPTAPLSAITNTAFLICHTNRFIDASTNNFAITVTGDSKVVAFSPFAATAVYNPVSHGGSVYLDGTGDYLNTGSDVGLNLGVGNFTWEFWTYLTASPADGNVLFQPRTPAGIDAVLFGYKSGSNFTIYATTDGGGSWNLFSNTVIIAVADVLNRWAHWAFTRNGNTYTVYVDGVSKVTGTSANQISQATNVFTLGATVSGYFSGFRFVKAQALSTGNFTPPTVPLTANTVGWTGANVATSLTGTVNLLLNFTDSAILDSTGRNVIETVADSKTSSVITKFTGGSMYFDGTGDYIIMPDVLTGQFGTGDFTVEYWDRHGSQGTNYATQVGTLSSATGSGSWRFGTFSNSAGVYLAYHNGTSFIDVVFGSTVYNDNIWRHFALSRQGTTVRAFVDGVQVGSNQTVSQNFNSSNRVILGAELTSPTYFTGYIADLRITRGYARYTANFTAPTVPARLK